MKNILLFFIFLLFLDGVFGESVSVMEGDSVTLHTDVTEIQKDDVIDWRFGGDLIARINRPVNKNEICDDVLHGKFKDRLKLQEQNGDLTIINIRTTDSGDYKVTISSNLKNPKIFSVKVVSAGGVTVSVKEGDSVTLRTGLTEIQRDHVIRWRFGQQRSLVAEINRTAAIFNTYDGPDERFRDRLQLDHQTGSLTIRNINTTDSGPYEAEISSSSRYTIHKSFSVTVSDDVVSVSVLERDNVTLCTGLTAIQTGDEILWKFGVQDKPIAEFNETWRNFGLNSQTRNLTISNIQKNQSGHYKVEIITRRMILQRKCRITIGEMKSVTVKEGDSVTLPTITEVQSDDLIVWMFGNIRLAEIHKTENRFYIYDGPDGRFRGRLKLDHQTVSLIIMNIRTTDSGEYELKISSSRCTINRRIHVTVSGSDPRSDSDPRSGSDPRSDSDLSRAAVAVIAGVGVLLVAAVVAAVVVFAVVMYYRRKISELERRREENGQNLKTQATGVPANEKTELYSEESTQ